MRRAVLSPVSLPDFGEPATEPTLDRPVFEARIDRLQARMAAEGLDAVVIYGDREHAANIAWACGYDPRFEEAVFVVPVRHPPTLIAGNEGLPYADLAPGSFRRLLWQPLSLMGQPRDRYRALPELLREAGLSSNTRIGLAGWKGFESEDGVFDPLWFETPHYLVEALRRFGMVTNAALLFMHPETGLRAINEVDQLAAFEYAAARTSAALRRLILGARPGMSEREAASLLRLDGAPHSVHLMLSAGPRARYGLPSPSTRPIGQGEPITCAFGLMGGLNCRAGFMAASAADLPAAIRDYVERLVAPYFEAIAAWYETLAIGATGSSLHEAVMSRIGTPFFGVGLNPGHLIHLDEWLHSPVKQGSALRLRSGMALQCDVIPATGSAYFTANAEDGLALADQPLREEFAARHPGAWARIEARRTFMAETLGIRLRPEVLPFSNIAGWLPPFWLSPGEAMVMTGA